MLTQMHFFPPSKHKSCFAIFQNQKKSMFWQNPFSDPPQKRYVSGPYLQFLLLQEKNCTFLSESLIVDIPTVWENKNTTLAPLLAICDFKKARQHYKVGQDKPNILGPDIDATLGPICVCVYIYMP